MLHMTTAGTVVLLFAAIIVGLVLTVHALIGRRWELTLGEKYDNLSVYRGGKNLTETQNSFSPALVDGALAIMNSVPEDQRRQRIIVRDGAARFLFTSKESKKMEAVLKQCRQNLADNLSAQKPKNGWLSDARSGDVPSDFSLSFQIADPATTAEALADSHLGQEK